ncbi:Uncharacterised protein [Chlamydia trachomatis]|nr:Uncharacterised protein [Chlamydia trachomatis]
MSGSIFVNQGAETAIAIIANETIIVLIFPHQFAATLISFLTAYTLAPSTNMSLIMNRITIGKYE